MLSGLTNQNVAHRAGDVRNCERSFPLFDSNNIRAGSTSAWEIEEH